MADQFYTLTPELRNASVLHRKEEVVLINNLRAAEKALEEHRKHHPYNSKEVFLGITKAICDRMVARGLLSEPKVTERDIRHSDYAASISGHLNDKHDVTYELRLVVRDGILCASRADSIGVGYLHLGSSRFDLDKLIDEYMQRYELPAEKEPLNKKVASAAKRVPASRVSVKQTDKNKGRNV